MIVKKIPILQGFPCFDTVKKLSHYAGKFSEFSPIFYDIETTGLSKKNAFVYLIGAVRFEEDRWILQQWFAKTKEEEPEILEAFQEFLKNADCTVQYNGDAFDQPFLAARYGEYQAADPLGALPSIDLYRRLRCLKGLLALPAVKQTDLERILGLAPRKYLNGREEIRCYREYARDPLPETLEELLGHNQEDLIGLAHCFRLLSCLALFQGDFLPVLVSYEDEELRAVLELPLELPADLSLSLPGFQLRAHEKQARLVIRAENRRLRIYYENYRDYVYLPGEDTVIPRSLSSYMEKSLYVPAGKDTCYTWFSVNERFLADVGQQTAYLKSVLNHYLNQSG